MPKLVTRHTSHVTRRGAAAFTLIELLIVIAIIAILAGLAFPAVQGALNSSKRAQARNDVNQLAAAVKSYMLEYGHLPEAGNEIKVLTGDNAKKITFFEAKQAGGDPPKNGLSEDGTELFDPWGKAYTFLLDDNYDNKVEADVGAGTQNYITTVIVVSEGDSKGKISNVK